MTRTMTVPFDGWYLIYTKGHPGGYYIKLKKDESYQVKDLIRAAYIGENYGKAKETKTNPETTETA